MNVDHLPAALRRRPEVAALALRVYRESENTFKVPGTDRIHDVYRVDGTLRCTCIAAIHGHLGCKHVIAVRNYLKKEAS